MTQTAYPFENVDVSETQFSQFFRNLGAGVNGSPTGTELKVTAGTGLQVAVAAGQAMVRGHYYISTASELLTIGTANGSNPRIDSIVLTLDPTANSVILAVVAGTPAASPVAPTLTQTDAGVYQMLIGTVLIPAAAVVVSTITDSRLFLGSRFGVWSTAGRPSAPITGQAGFNSTLAYPEFWNGTSWEGLVTTTNVGSLAPQGNAVINGGFDIWQRGTSINTAASTFTYTADRFWLYSNGPSVTTSRQLTSDATNLPHIQYCARLQRQSGQTATTSSVWNFPIETVNSIPFAGKQVTVSFYARKSATFTMATGTLSLYLLSGTGTDESGLGGFTGESTIATKNAMLSTTWQRFTTTGTVATTAKELRLEFNSGSWVGTAGAADYVEITGVQLEAGSVATPFKRNAPSLQAELAACQRYYWAITPGLSKIIPCSANMFSATELAAVLQFPQTMRTTPSMETTSGTDHFAFRRAGAVDTFDTFKFGGETTDTGAFLYQDQAISGTAGQAGIIKFNNAAARLAFSAEL